MPIDLVLGNTPNTISISTFDSITGGTAADMVTVTTAVTGATVNLGAGLDALTLAAGGNTLTVSNTETITGGAGDDLLTLATALAAGLVALGAGTGDSLTLANGSNTLTVSGAETITGGTGADAITLAAAVNGASIVLGAGADSLKLADAANTLTLAADVESITGGTAADAITVTGTIGASISGGGGNDTIVGGGGADQLTGGLGTDSLTGGAGTDRFVYQSLTHSVPGVAADVITDFTASSDLLVISGLLKGSFNFVGAATFSATGNSEAKFDDTSKSLTIDTDGNGVTDFALTLTGVSLVNLSNGDFIWL